MSNNENKAGREEKTSTDETATATAAKNFNESKDSDTPIISFNAREHVRQGVEIWGDRGPQPIFDGLSTLATIDTETQNCIGFHRISTVKLGPNKKTDVALGPECSEEVIPDVLPAGKVSVTPRVALNPTGLRKRFEEYIDGNITLTDEKIINSIHILDMDFTDVDNCIAMLLLQKTLDNSNCKYPLFVFVSVRKMGSKLSPLQLHMGENGPIKTDEGKVQFKVGDPSNPNTFKLTDNLGPFIKELSYESNFHNEEDMKKLHDFAATVCVRQLNLQNSNNEMKIPARVGKLGSFEIAGLSHNVHKLEMYFYNRDGSYSNTTEYKKKAKNYFNIGIINEDDDENTTEEKINAREKLFNETLEQFGTEPTESFDKCIAFLREEKNLDVPIIVHCAGPMFALNELSKHDDLRNRISRIGAMFLAHDGEANLLGRNFNEGVCPKMTEDLWGTDAQNIHNLFPSAEIICVTTETCKQDGLTFVP